MIILRNMGTIHLLQAALPALDFHHAIYTKLFKVTTQPSGRRKCSCTIGVTLVAHCANSNRASRCRTYLARGWWSRVYRLAPRRNIGCITNPCLSRGNTSPGKMGYPQASGIHGQPRTPHTDSHTYRDWTVFDDIAPRQASCDDPCSHGAYLTNAVAAAKGDLQQLGQFELCLQNGGRLV